MKELTSYKASAATAQEGPQSNMSVDRLIQQGLQSRLVQLEELRLEFVGESPPLQVCADCYMLAEECYCVTPMFWALDAVIYKLRAEVRRDDVAVT